MYFQGLGFNNYNFSEIIYLTIDAEDIDRLFRHVIYHTMPAD